MALHIIGDTTPQLGKNIYILSGVKVKEEHWKLYKKEKLILDLGTDGRVTFSQAALGIHYVIKVDYTDDKGIKGSAKLEITPVAGKPAIQALVWKDEYYNNLNGRQVGYSDNIRLFVYTLNIPVGETLEITIWEDQGTDGHADSSRNMSTYIAKVNKYGEAQIYFNNLKAYMKILNDKDYYNEGVHEFYAQIKYKNIINTIEDTKQVKVINTLIKQIAVSVYNKPHTVEVPDKKEDLKNVVGIKVTVNVFFDGTKNNATNTAGRLAYNKQKQGIVLKDVEEIKRAAAYKKHTEDESSYENFYSNVAIMQQINSVNKENKEIKIYIEGEGTENLEGDDSKGYAFGSGKTGIPAKVTKAFTEIKAFIDDLKKGGTIKKDEFVNEIALTVFGFSRGAAAARHFISRKHELQEEYDVNKDMIYVNFVGLFDTVSSYHESYSTSPNFDNDVEGKKGLGLKMEGNVQKVVHLTAADEYREFFSLTNIKSSIAAGVGYELELPGSHSDIGGGYGEIEDEKRHLHLEKGYDNIKETVLKEGWYVPEQVFESVGEKTVVWAKRTALTNSYQYIPLAIMVQLAEKYGLQFEKSFLEKGKKETYKIPDDLQQAKKSLMSYALENDGAVSKRVTIHSEYLHPIRNKYLHRSTSDALGKTGRYKDGKPYRKHHDG